MLYYPTFYMFRGEEKAQKACGDISKRKSCSAGNVAAARVDRVARDAAGEWRLDRQTVDCCPGADQWWKQGLSENHFPT